MGDKRTLNDIADYEWLTGPEAGRLLGEFAESTEPVLQQLNRLRKVLTAERARLITEQVALRKKAANKFGSLAERMFFTDVGLQQATDIWIARYKAERFGDQKPAVDYCCGIGGDLVALAERGSVVGWDQDAGVATFARANAYTEVCVGDVEQQTPDGAVWHLDPDRRVDGRRSTQVQWHSPGPEVVDRWRQTCADGCLKLAPAARVPEVWEQEGELEWITRERECRQLVVWFGELASENGKRRATVLTKPAESESRWLPSSFAGNADAIAPVAEQVGNFVYDTDPSLRASGLVGALGEEMGLAVLSGGASYLTSDSRIEHGLVSCFEVEEVVPFRVGSLSKLLRARGIGRLEIKKRGVEVVPERLRQQLKLKGSEGASLLIGKVGVSEVAILGRRCGGE